MKSARWLPELLGECRDGFRAAGEYGGDGYALSGFTSLVVDEVSFAEP